MSEEIECDFCGEEITYNCHVVEHGNKFLLLCIFCKTGLEIIQGTKKFFKGE